ncbi:hypothetical protein [Mucilaginibacter sp. CSA2-8R]|uniref:hypothetical protein n=1 Tax=Mucilaginibacter sp. CSA2-8R TaxID=3141542 RepID=UPI00315CAB45
MSYSEIELADYIVKHYSELLSLSQKMILKQYRHSLKLADRADRERLISIYTRSKWLSGEPETFAQLDGGYSNFIINCSKELLSKHGADIVINICPQCGRLARTPLAKQCRHCFFDWH